MDYRGVLLAVGVVASATVAMTTACSGPDPGQITFSERPHQGPESTSGAPGGDGGSSGTSGGGDGGDGGSSGSTVIDAFTGAPPYAAGAANGTSNNAQHPNGNQNPAGNNCLDCHKTGGAGTPWVFAGTVYTSLAGPAAGAGVEVRLVDAAGKEQAKVYTDANGNFWIDTIAAGQTIPAGSHIGVRNSATPKLMATLMGANPTDGGCANTGCHVAGKQGHISLQ